MGGPHAWTRALDLSIGLPFDPVPLAFGLPGAPAGSFEVYSFGILRVQLAQPPPSPGVLNRLGFIGVVGLLGSLGISVGLSSAGGPSMSSSFSSLERFKSPILDSRDLGPQHVRQEIGCA